jgi:hypothetical protein
LRSRPLGIALHDPIIVGKDGLLNHEFGFKRVNNSYDIARELHERGGNRLVLSRIDLAKYYL